MYANEKAKAYRTFLNRRSADVLGAGISNAPLINFLLDCGASVTVRDRKEKNELPLDVESLEKRGVRFVNGEGYLDGIGGEIIFRTPGIRCDASGITEAVANGALLTSEMEAFISICPCKIIAITGSDGKTTTSTLCAKILEAHGYRVHLGGNIGTPLLAKIDEISPEDFAVLELSSFQLHTVNRFENEGLPFAHLTFPDGGIITNVSPNHLNWHTDMAEYAESKCAVYKYMSEEGVFVTNADYPYTADFAEKARQNGHKNVVLFSSKKKLDEGFFIDNDRIVRRKNGVNTTLLTLDEILLPGIHNAENYMAAAAVTENYVTPDDVKSVAHTFGGVEHRLELCGVRNGVRFFNSSIDSSPSRTLAALSTFPQKKSGKEGNGLVIIMGGADKNIPFDCMGSELVKKARAVFLSGPTSQKIEDCIKNAEGYSEGCIEITQCQSFDTAVRAAAEFATDGDTVLLSPACTSFDAFKNFEERGKRFKTLVKEFVNGI